MGTADTEDPHRRHTVVIIVALAAVFGLAALTVIRGAGPAEVIALVVAGGTAAERLIQRRRRSQANRTHRPGSAVVDGQWGPPAATEDPRPQIAEPSRRPDREFTGPRDTPGSRQRDRRVTECGDVTSSLSTHPGSDGAVPAEVQPMTPADAVSRDDSVAAGRRRPDRSISAARSTRR